MLDVRCHGPVDYESERRKRTQDGEESGHDDLSVLEDLPFTEQTSGDRQDSASGCRTKVLLWRDSDQPGPGHAFGQDVQAS